MSIRPVSSTMGQSTPATVAEGTRWYRYNGKQPEEASPSDPLPQNAKATSAKQKRFAEFTRLRLEDVPKEQAAEQVGIRLSTMHYYEREFQDQQRREGGDG